MPSETNIAIRAENAQDEEETAAIRRINEIAFGGNEEAELVDNLRTTEAVLVSLVAINEGQLVGHVLFSRMSIQTAECSVPAVALAPIAVLPDFQRKGIGEKLIRHGLDLLRSSGEQIVIVVGHPDYYPRFGFSVEKARDLQSPFPPEAFMALELSEGALAGIRGKVRYPPAFGIF